MIRIRNGGKKQVVVGLLCDEGGDAVSVEVFRGNTRNFDTFGRQVKKAVEEFGCQRVTFVGDRGMIKSGQIAELNQAGFHYITAITKPEIEKLLKIGVFQMGLFDKDISEPTIHAVLNEDGYQRSEFLPSYPQSWERGSEIT
jgi:transposase